MMQGDRRSASASDSLASFDIDTPAGQEALAKLFGFLQKPEWKEVREGLQGVVDLEKPNVSHFLNRLLGLKVSQLKQIFRFYEALLTTAVAQAKKDGRHDVGVSKIKGTSISLESRFGFNYRYEVRGIIDKQSDSIALLKEFSVDRGISFEAAYEIYQREKAEDPNTLSCFCTYTYTIQRVNNHGTPLKTTHTQTNYALALERGERGQRLGQGSGGFTSTYMLLVRPNTGYSSAHIPWGEWSGKWVPAEERDLVGPDGVSWRRSAFAEFWAKGMEKNSNARVQKVGVLIGDILPVLPKISKRSGSTVNIVKIETTTTYPPPQAFIGILVPKYSSIDKCLSSWWATEREIKVISDEVGNIQPSIPVEFAAPSESDDAKELSLVEKLALAGWWEHPPHPLDARAAPDQQPEPATKEKIIRKKKKKNSDEELAV